MYNLCCQVYYFLVEEKMFIICQQLIRLLGNDTTHSQREPTGHAIKCLLVHNVDKEVNEMGISTHCFS